MVYYAYLIQCVGTNYYKIGTAHSPEEKLKELQIGSPYPLKLVLACRMLSKDEAATAENQIYKTLKKYSVRGEWFEVPDDNDDDILNHLRFDLVAGGIGIERTGLE